MLEHQYLFIMEVTSLVVPGHQMFIATDRSLEVFKPFSAMKLCLHPYSVIYKYMQDLPYRKLMMIIKSSMRESSFIMKLAKQACHMQLMQCGADADS